MIDLRSTLATIAAQLAGHEGADMPVTPLEAGDLGREIENILDDIPPFEASAADASLMASTIRGRVRVGHTWTPAEMLRVADVLGAVGVALAGAERDRRRVASVGRPTLTVVTGGR